MFLVSEGVSNICSLYNIVQYILFITEQTLQHQSEEFSGVLIIFLYENQYKTENQNMFNMFRLKTIDLKTECRAQ